MTKQAHQTPRQSWVGPYRIDRWLGTGELGAVFLGYRAGSGAAAVVRLLRPELLAQRELRARLRRQLAAQRKPHTGVIMVQDMDLDADLPWVATEYVDGPTLASELAGGRRLAGAGLDRLAVATATALRALHHDGVVHQDLQPSRVRRAPSGRWLVDIGTAPVAPAYLTPERLRREVPAAAADVFAWGALLTEAATGRPPFGSDAAAQAKILAGEPELGDLPAPLRGLVVEALRPDPDRRPSADALVARLAELHPELTTEALKGTPREPATDPGSTTAVEGAGPGWRPRHRWAVPAAVGAVVAAIVAATALAIVLPRGEPQPLSGQAITIGVVNDWDEGIAASFLWKVALEEQGADVTVEFANVDVIYSGVAIGKYDIAFDAWLPDTHERLWAEHGRQLEDLGAWLTGAELTIAVNEDAPIESLTELSGAADDFGGRLFGIEEEAGLTGAAERVIDAYGLQELEFFTESTPAMLTMLRAAIDRGDNVVVTLWEPIWLYEALDIHNLEDPLGVLGDTDDIHSIGRPGFAEAYPKIADWVGEFTMTADDLISLERVMFEGHDASTSAEYEAAVREWLDGRPGYLSGLVGGRSTP